MNKKEKLKAILELYGIGEQTKMSEIAALATLEYMKYDEKSRVFLNLLNDIYVPVSKKVNKSTRYISQAIYNLKEKMTIKNKNIIGNRLNTLELLQLLEEEFKRFKEW